MKHGLAFGDYIRKEKGQRRSYSFNEEQRTFSTAIILITFVIVGLVLLVRLIFIQISQGSYYSRLADSNRTKTVFIHAPRGIIFDRKGNQLVYNLPGYRELINGRTVIVSSNEALLRLAHGDKKLEIDSLRYYPFKEITAHVLGYLGQISPQQLDTVSSKSAYKVGDLIGQMGIEQAYEDNLRGIDGKKLIEVDATGRVIKTIGQSDPLPGKNVSLTLDIKLQEAVAKSMQNIKKGAVIVSTPTGDILALFSKPDFDPNLFSLGKEYKTNENTLYPSITSVLQDGENQPLLNRAISGQYPPGSTFKLITAIAGLKDKVIDKNYTVEDTGKITIGNFSFANWYYTQYGKTDGTVDVVTAIKRSNDIFFYLLGDKLGVTKLSQTAKEFGLGKKLGIDLEGESTGLVPTKEWKKKYLGEDWYLGDNYHYGIGQGYLLVTPLQVNVWTQVIANGGTLYAPQLAKREKSILAKDLFDNNIQQTIRQGMIESCQTGGVAYPLFSVIVKNKNLPIDNKNFFPPEDATSSSHTEFARRVSVACKTGTAQQGGEESLPHSWITLFAPAYNPQIVLTVLAESAGEGSQVAGPIARDIVFHWFSHN